MDSMEVDGKEKGGKGKRREKRGGQKVTFAPGTDGLSRLTARREYCKRLFSVFLSVCLFSIPSSSEPGFAPLIFRLLKTRDEVVKGQGCPKMVGTEDENVMT